MCHMLCHSLKGCHPSVGEGTILHTVCRSHKHPASLLGFQKYCSRPDASSLSKSVPVRCRSTYPDSALPRVLGFCSSQGFMLAPSIKYCSDFLLYHGTSSILSCRRYTTCPGETVLEMTPRCRISLANELPYESHVPKKS